MLNINIHNFKHRTSDCPILMDVKFKVEDREFVTIIGSSATGKTTLLNLIAGLLPLKKGKIIFNETIYNSQAGCHIPDNFSFVFQETHRSLLPWLTVYENIKWVINHKKDNDLNLKVDDIIEKVGLSKYKKTYPHLLSGGLKQRLALARAIIVNPRLLILDEPFSSLDWENRTIMEDLLRIIWGKGSFSVLLVTHELDEAICLSQKILVLKKVKKGGNSSEESSFIVEQITKDIPISDVTNTKFIDIKEKLMRMY